MIRQQPTLVRFPQQNNSSSSNPAPNTPLPMMELKMEPIPVKPRGIARLFPKKVVLSSNERALFADIRGMFDLERGDIIRTDVLISKLTEHTVNGFTLNPVRLADILVKFNVRPLPNVKDASGRRGQGYRRRDFERVWRRYNVRATRIVVPTKPSPTATATPVQTVLTSTNDSSMISKERWWVLELDPLHWLTLTAAVALAGISAWFSINGMGTIFPGMMVSVTIMAICMEFGKLMGTAWISRNWYATGWVLRCVLVFLIVSLAGINAVGVFGQLSAAHLNPHVNATAVVDVRATTIAGNVQSQTMMVADYNTRITQIDAAIAKITERGRPTAALAIMKEYGDQRTDLLNKRIIAEKSLAMAQIEQSKIAGEKSVVEADAGVMRYAAGIMHLDREQVIQLLILCMVLSCDPLSITLVIATALTSGRKKKPVPT